MTSRSTKPDEGPGSTCNRLWLAQIEALQFSPRHHGGDCTVHRLAFRTLLGFMPEAADCLVFFDAHADRFEQAAQIKIRRGRLAPDARFHLNSRDLRRVLPGG